MRNGSSLGLLITNLQSGKEEVMHLRSNYGGHTHLVAMDTFWEMNCDESPNLCRWSSWKAWLHLPVNQQFVPLPDNPEKTKRVYVHGYVCMVHCTYVFVAPDSYCFLHFVLYQEMLVMPNGRHADVIHKCIEFFVNRMRNGLSLLLFSKSFWRRHHGQEYKPFHVKFQ